MSARVAAAAAGTDEAGRAQRLSQIREDACGFVDHPSGFLALSPRNQFFTRDGAPGFVAYRERGRHMVAFGGVHAPADAREPLLDAFLDAAAQRGLRVMVVQLRDSQAALFVKRGFTVNALGTSYAMTLRGFTMAGTKKMKLRNKIKRARSEGLTIKEIGREWPRNDASFARLRQVSDEWLAAKGKKELEFMIGELGDERDTARRIFAAVDADDQAQAFITYVPVWGERPGVLHDLTRKRPSAAVGALELCNSAALERFTAEGVPFLHFGFTPFIVDAQPGAAASRPLHWLVLQLRQRGQFIYSSETQANYKMKWGPDVLEQEYVAGRPLSLRAVVDLLMLTRAV